MFDAISHLLPIELTVQNLYFHDNGSIFSISENGNTFITCGADKEIRLWSVSDHVDEKQTIQENKIEKNYNKNVDTRDKICDLGNTEKNENASCVDVKAVNIEYQNNVQDIEYNTEKNENASCVDEKAVNTEYQNNVQDIEYNKENVKIDIMNDVANNAELNKENDFDATRISSNDNEPTQKNKFVTNEAYNSSVSVKYIKTYSHHQKSVNCVRYSDCKKFFASCADGGEVCVWKDDKKFVVRESDGDDAYELLWIRNYLAVGTASGKIYLYNIEDSENNLNKKQTMSNEESDKLQLNILSNQTCINTENNTQTESKMKESQETEEINQITAKYDTNKEPNNENKKIENNNDVCTIKSNIDVSELDICTEILEDVHLQNDAKTNNKTEKIKNTKKVKLSKITTIQQTFKCKHIQTIKAHTDIIQGMAFNKKYNVIVTCSKDRSIKTFYLDKKLVFIDKIDTFENEKCFADENTKTLFRRPSFSFCCKFLYLSACVDKENNFCVFILNYPFRSIDFYGKIGSFDSPAIKILSNEYCTLVMCKKSVYYIENNKVLFSIKNVSFFPMTDCCYINQMFCFTSLDGFIYTLRLQKDKKFPNNQSFMQ